MSYSIINPNLYLIALDQKMTGFRNFIGAWLYKSDAIAFLVDPGPRYSVNQLTGILKKIGVRRLDYILLTHIHIDHAGGTGALLAHYPEARIICHPRAVSHMVSPQNLWQGSLKNLGVIAESYGEIIPVPTGAIEFRDRIETPSGDIKAIDTPGHAVHHLCFQFQDYLFAGEAAGIINCLHQGIYARPTTPPIFKLKTSLSSIDRIMALDVSMICFGHYGFRTDVKQALTTAQSQLLNWVEMVKNQLEKGEDNLDKRIIEGLKTKDPSFANITYLPEDIRRREIYFIGNSLKGMKEYLNAAGPGQRARPKISRRPER